MKRCILCKNDFEIEKDDYRFYEKIGPIINGEKIIVDPPRECPSCRELRRWAYRNQSSLYKTKSALSGKEMISLYPADTKYTVYKEDEWWTDKWNALDYGQEYNFSRPFFEQFYDLQQKVPRRALQQDGSSENSEYTTYGTNNKNCYMTFSCGLSENVYYSDWSFQMKECLDCTKCIGGELLYECTDSNNCYSSMYLKNCNDCRDSYFLEDCYGCSNCIACKNLVDKQYYYFNKEITKDEYNRLVKEAKKNNFSKLSTEFEKWRISQPTKFARIIASEDCTGNNIFKAKNCKKCFDMLLGAEDCKYCYFSGGGAKDMFDCNMTGQGSELVYEMQATVGSYNCAFINFCRVSKNCFYCDSVGSCDSCFGCIGLSHNSYCILNKQYSKQEYEAIVPKIIEHMRQNGEWGVGFPIKNSPFPFNDTVANELYPTKKSDALKRGFIWNDNKVIAQDERAVTKDVLKCEACHRRFNLIPHEVFYYKRMGICNPTKCFFCRRKARLTSRINYALFKRQCMCEEAGHGHEGRCPNEFETTYAPDRSEIIYCQKCYETTIN